MEISTVFDSNSIPALDKTVREKRLPSDILVANMTSILGRFPPSKKAALTGLALLWHDHWDDSHSVVQRFEGDSDCDLVHGILHRREGDLANARYWCSQVPKHPAFAPIAAAMESARDRYPSISRFVKNGAWSPMAFLTSAIQKPHFSEYQNIQALELKAIAQFWWPDPE
jgi:hypothetical protein